MQLNDKYNNLVQDANDTSINDHYASIIQFKKSQAKIDLLISLPQTEQEEKQQLKTMKENIQTALKQEINMLRSKQKKLDLYPLSAQLLNVEDVGKLTKYYIQQDKKWKNAVVLQVDAEEQVAKIKKYGSNQTVQMPAYFLKVLKEPDSQQFQEGGHCKAIYSGDGEFYPCVIEKIDQEGYHVRYKKYNSQEVVVLHRLRPMQNPNQKNQQIKFEDLNQFKIPQKLKIQPNDPENVKKSKKTKLKALKFAFKNAQVDQQNKQKQQKWKSWNTNSAKSGYFKTKQQMQILSKKK